MDDFLLCLALLLLLPFSNIAASELPCVRLRDQKNPEQALKAQWGDDAGAFILSSLNRQFPSPQGVAANAVCSPANHQYLLFVDGAANSAQGIYFLDSSRQQDDLEKVSGYPLFLEWLRDRSGHAFALVRSDALRGGKFATSLGLFDTSSRQTQDLYSGAQDGESGGCERSEMLGIRTALIKIEYGLEDLNGDGVTDIRFNIQEENCSNHRLNQFQKNFIALQNGFINSSGNGRKK